MSTDAQKSAGVWPTEIIFFHLLVVGGVLGTALSARVGVSGLRYNLFFVVFSVVIYWVVRQKLRKSNRLKRWWQNQVRSPGRSRFSAGVAIILLDTLHILLAFCALFFIVANLIYWFEFAGSKPWQSAFLFSVSSAGLSGPDFTPLTNSGRLLAAASSLLGLVFTALWVAVFTKSFDTIFRYE
jgi:hypothetical protein